MKKPELETNWANGIDLIVERDSGNPVRILTGKPSASRRFWKQIQKSAEIALDELKGKKDN